MGRETVFEHNLGTNELFVYALGKVGSSTQQINVGKGASWQAYENSLTLSVNDSSFEKARILLWILPKLPDTDGDGLSDFEETSHYGTDPYKVDTDGDGVTDGEEVIQGTDPTIYNEPGDVFYDGQSSIEDAQSTEPLQPSMVNDGLHDLVFIYLYLFSCFHASLWEITNELTLRYHLRTFS
jgi:hypothetical protein